MKKINKTHFWIALILSSILIFSLIKQYDNFNFHTFHSTTQNLKLYDALNENYKIDFYQVNHEKKKIKIGDAKISILNSEIDFNNLSVESVLNGEKYKHEIILENESEIYLKPIYLDTVNIDDLYLIISSANQSDELKLNEIKCKVLSGQNKNYSINNVYINENTIHFGNFNNIYKENFSLKYPNIQIEYRYKNNKNKGEDSNVVFYSQSGQTTQVIDELSSHIQEINLPNDLVLEDLPINIVVILKNDTELIFSIDLK